MPREEDDGFYDDAELPTTVNKPKAVNTFDLDEENGAAGTARGGAIGNVLRNSAHPKVALFHIGFKAAAVASYLLLGIFLRNFVVQFVVTVTLLAFEFWTTKNVSGRLMVGLRWWTDVNEEGSTQWRFECVEDANMINAVDSRIFWWTLYLQPAVWIGLGAVCIVRFEFKWLLVVSVALTLTITNLVAYFKCSQQQQEQMQGYMTSAVIQRAMSLFR